MADDPVEAARRKYSSMLRRSSYFPAANLRQFEGTELSPPGAGTYFNPQRYVGFHGNINQVQRNLARQYQSDLAYNVQANPIASRNLEAEGIGARYASRRAVDPNDKYFGFGTGRASPATTRAYYAGHTTGVSDGLRTIQLPSGGTATIQDSPRYGGGATLQRPSPEQAYQLGYTGQPSFTGTNAFQKSYLQGLARIGSLAYNALSGLFRANQPKFASERGDLLRDTEGTFYGGGHAPPTPTPTPFRPQQYADSGPMRYFD